MYVQMPVVVRPRDELERKQIRATRLNVSPEPILVEAAWKWIAYDETAAWRYRQLVANTGSSKKAIVAMARRLGVLLWRLSVHGELYEITRVDPKVLWALDYHRLRERFARKIV